MTDTNELIDLAKAAFTAYTSAVGGTSVTGGQIPPWEQLGDTVQNAWVASAQAIWNVLMGPDAADD